MSKQFFYNHTQAIRALCKQEGVTEFKLSFHEEAASIYLGFSDSEDFAIKANAFKNALLNLANSVNEGATIYQFSITDVKALEREPLNFEDFLSQGVIEGLQRGIYDRVKNLTAAGVNTDYKDLLTQKTALEVGLQQLFLLYADFGKTEEMDKAILADLPQLSDCIRSLVALSNKASSSSNNLELIGRVISELSPIQLAPMQAPAAIIRKVLVDIDRQALSYYGKQLCEMGYQGIANDSPEKKAAPVTPVFVTNLTSVFFPTPPQSASNTQTNQQQSSLDDDTQLENLARKELGKALKNLTQQGACNDKALAAIMKVAKELSVPSSPVISC